MYICMYMNKAHYIVHVHNTCTLSLHTYMYMYMYMYTPTVRTFPYNPPLLAHTPIQVT